MRRREVGRVMTGCTFLSACSSEAFCWSCGAVGSRLCSAKAMALQSKRGAYGCGGTQGSRGGEARLAACSTTAARAPQQQRRVVVVGLGVGGLVMAGRLARAGYDVTAVERGADAGGRMQSESSESSVRFDTGPSLLLFPHKYREA